MNTVERWKSKVEKRGYNRTTDRDGYTDGEVITPWGFVSVYAQGDERHHHCTRLDFVHDGFMHTKQFNDKRYTKRAIKTKAFEFAKEVVNDEL